MEPWQRDHILAQKTSLLREIKCTTPLLEALRGSKVISLNDFEKISSPMLGNSEKVSALLNVIETRVNAFNLLIDALTTDEQSGAVSILRNHANVSNIGGNGDTLPRPSGSTVIGVLVGDPGCTFGSIVLEIEKVPGANEFLRDWRGLARRLEIPLINRDELARDLESRRKSLIDVLEEMLIIWKNQMTSQATLTSLITIIRDSGSNVIADRLQEKYLS